MSVAAPALKGRTEPRLWTRPLRPLTEETSLGFEVIDFARVWLGVVLYPWQQWLLIHALELREDGSYRFSRIVVLVARQQGKTMLASVLAAWWLFMDSERHPDRVPPLKFKVVGVAQNLDIAREPWSGVKMWCDPDPDTAEEAELAIPVLQHATAKVSDTNGKESIVARSRAHYEIRAAKNARGKPAARVLMDEMREQKTWDAWNAVSPTTKAFWSGQLWALSNAGDLTAIVLAQLRNGALAAIKEWDEYVTAGLVSAEEYANDHDVSTGLFEWSAPDGCAKNDIEGILQANPSIGYGAQTVQGVLADIGSMTDAGYRTEDLCQWVTSREESHLDKDTWPTLADEESVLAEGRAVLGVCVSGNRSYTSVGVAGSREDGLTHLELIAQREGMLWVVDFCRAVRRKTGMSEVALQSRGVPSAELVGPLEDAGFTVHKIEATPLLNMAGRMRDATEAGRVRHRSQPALNMAAENGTAKMISGMPVWDLFESPVDVAPVAAVNAALYALETTAAPEQVEVPPPPPKAEAVPRVEGGTPDENLATVRF